MWKLIHLTTWQTYRFWGQRHMVTWDSLAGDYYWAGFPSTRSLITMNQKTVGRKSVTDTWNAHVGYSCIRPIMSHGYTTIYIFWKRKRTSRKNKSVTTQQRHKVQSRNDHILRALLRKDRQADRRLIISNGRVYTNTWRNYWILKQSRLKHKGMATYK